MSLLVTACAALVVLLTSTRVAGCSDRCDYSTLSWVTRAFSIADITVFIVSTAVYFVLRPRFRRAWIAPVGGIVLTLIALAVTTNTMNGALALGQ